MNPPSDPRRVPAGIPGPADRGLTSGPGGLSGALPGSLPALPEDAALQVPPLDDAATLVPDPLGDAPGYVPPPVGMLPGAIVPPVDPSHVPTSAWITSAPPSRRSALSTIVTLAAIAIAVVVVGGIIAVNLRLFEPRGQVLFGTSLGPNLCSVGGETRTLRTSDPVYFAAVLRNRLGGDDQIRLSITRDGQPFFETTEPADGTTFECYGSRESIGPLEPGVYVFEVTHEGAVEAVGTLTVT